MSHQNSLQNYEDRENNCVMGCVNYRTVQAHYIVFNKRRNLSHSSYFGVGSAVRAKKAQKFVWSKKSPVFTEKRELHIFGS